jgi:ribosomal protein L22
MSTMLENKPLGVAIAQLSSVLDEEIAALRVHDHAVITATTERKAQFLLELTRRSVPSEISRFGGLDELRQKLEANMRLLAVHVRASTEIAGLLKRVLSNAEDDGTYCPPVRRSGQEK